MTRVVSRTSWVRYETVKVYLDKFFAALLLALLSPIMACVAILILICDGAPILFKQVRIGKDERSFTILKFRTFDNIGQTLQGNQDLEPTHLGRVLRRLSLDELPNLWNVLRGEMAIVGPRPLLPEYLGIYSEEHKRRHTVLPGMTGLAQVSGRNRISWAQRLELDVEYAKSFSFHLDAKIVFLTIRLLLSIPGKGKKEEVSAPLSGGYIGQMKR